MASVFDTMFADAGLPALMDTLGSQGIEYLEPEENPVIVTAIVTNMEVVEEEGASSGNRRKIARRDVIIATDADGPYGGVAEPRISAKVKIDGWWWDVFAIEMQSGSMARLSVKRVTTTELARQGYRGR